LTSADWRCLNPRSFNDGRGPLANIAQIEPNGVFRHAKLRDLDLTDSKLNSVHFIESEISNCRFDRCDLRGLRLWATTIRESSFRGANLRDTPLGVAAVEGPYRGKRNAFVGVDFTEADLRGTVYVATSFERCTFRRAKLVKIDFGTSTFSDCQFEGDLREVIFWRSDLFARGFPEDAFPPNEMVNVDFSRAKFRWVEFRRLTLERVRLPNDREHIVIDDFATVLVAIFEIGLRWAVPKARGSLNTQDLAEAGEDAVERVLELLHQFGVKVN
jgi:uncharacterized protein YjbI with pentapeptide repeats